MPCVKLYYAGAATANAVASVQIPSATIIKGVQCSCNFDSITDGMQVILEVSRASAREIATNGAQQAICEVSAFGNFVTSGLAQMGINQFFPVHVPVVQGQLIYGHALVAGTVNYAATFILWY